MFKLSMLIALSALFYIANVDASENVAQAYPGQAGYPLQGALPEVYTPLPYPYYNYYPDYDEYNSPGYNQQRSNPKQATFPYHPV